MSKVSDIKTAMNGSYSQVPRRLGYAALLTPQAVEKSARSTRSARGYHEVPEDGNYICRDGL